MNIFLGMDNSRSKPVLTLRLRVISMSIQQLRVFERMPHLPFSYDQQPWQSYISMPSFKAEARVNLPIGLDGNFRFRGIFDSNDSLHSKCYMSVSGCLK